MFCLSGDCVVSKEFFKEMWQLWCFVTQDPSSEERFHVELHFSPGVKVSEEESAPMGFGFRPASAEVYRLSFVTFSHHVLD